jgi:endonuclease/exonuclease/phosphatase family metal-dependent hydrolase
MGKNDMKLRIMSNNQWWSDHNKPVWRDMGMDCSASVRVPGFIRMFKETDPDIIGLQECSMMMADMEMRGFRDAGMNYGLLWGRDTPILYKTDKFEVVDSTYLVYPTAVPGFEGEFNNLNTKSYCIAVLRSKENGKLLISGTTHLWYMSSNPQWKHYQLGSDEARVYQLGLMMDKAEELSAKYNCPIVIVGDMNAWGGAPCVQNAYARGYSDAREIATEYADGGHGMHKCGEDGYAPYEPADPIRAIDRVFIKNAPEGFVRRFDRFSEEYYMTLSDHLPVYIDVEL